MSYRNSYGDNKQYQLEKTSQQKRPERSIYKAEDQEGAQVTDAEWSAIISKIHSLPNGTLKETLISLTKRMRPTWDDLGF